MCYSLCKHPDSLRVDLQMSCCAAAKGSKQARRAVQMCRCEKVHMLTSLHEEGMCRVKLPGFMLTAEVLHVPVDASLAHEHCMQQQAEPTGCY